MQEAIAELGYPPNRAARNLRTRASHLVGLRLSPVQEGTANAAMDRFVHSLVWTSREAGYHVLLFPGEGPDPLEGYDDLLRSTAVDAFIVTDTYLATRRRPGCGSGAHRSWPSAARGTTRERRHPWVDVDGAAGTELATPHLIDRGPHPDRLDRLAQGLPDRRGPPRRVEPGDEAARAVHHRAGLPGRGHRAERRARPARCCSTRPSPRRSSAPPTRSRWGCSTRSPSAGLHPGRDIAVVGFDDSQVAQVVTPV